MNLAIITNTKMNENEKKFRMIYLNFRKGENYTCIYVRKKNSRKKFSDKHMRLSIYSTCFNQL